jgi:predicted Rossmann-fold nucleotide-binding protein
VKPARPGLQGGVIGEGVCSRRVAALAERVGRAIAEAGAVLLCGGLGGVMEAASRGAAQAGGFVVSALLVFLYSLDEFTGTLLVGAPFVRSTCTPRAWATSCRSPR